VEFGNKEGIERLATAVRFADTLLYVDTTDVQPMTSVVEDRFSSVRHFRLLHCCFLNFSQSGFCKVLL